MKRRDEIRPGGRKRWWRRTGARKALALALAGIGACLALFVMTRDLDWKRNHDAAMALGREAFMNGDITAARDSFGRAAAFNPFSADAHFSLANLCDTRLGDNEGALSHYLAGLECDPDHPRAGEAAKALAALDMIRSGRIEDPLDAVADMTLAVRDDLFAAFGERLDPKLTAFAGAYWSAWRERDSGALIQRRISQNDAGGFDAVLGFSFRDGSSMSMHFSCLAGQPWRLGVGFP